MHPPIDGSNIGILIRGTGNATRGQALAAVGSIRSSARFRAKIYLLTSEEGGRETPIHSGCRPQFYFRTLDVTGTVTLVGDNWAMPGDDVVVDVELVVPIALEKGLKFAIRENGRTIGAGTLIDIID